MSHATPRALLLLWCCFLCGCSGEPAAGAASMDGQIRRVEQFCSQPALHPSIRHTYLLLDQRMLSKADSVETFVAKNREVRDVLQSFGSPERATQGGVMDWRERLSLFLVPADGGAMRLLFTGCVPSLSPTEQTDAEHQQSAVGTFFGGSALTRLADGQKAFWGALAASVLQASMDAPAAVAPEVGDLNESPLIRSLHESGRVFNSESGLPRIVLLSNLAGIDLPAVNSLADARQAGLAAGVKSGLDFGFAELHVFLVDGPKADLAREYVKSFALAQNANLEGWGRRPNLMPTAPQSLWRFAGDVDLRTFRQAVQIRLAIDRNGKLVDSWFTLLGLPNTGIPMTGTLSCSTPGTACEGRADTGGFAQAWSPKTGTVPFFDANLPLGGARRWEVELRKDGLSGRIFDDAILIKPNPQAPGEHLSFPLKGAVATAAAF